MTRARDMANLGSQAGSGLDASDITSGVLPSGVTGGSGLTALGTVASGTLGSAVNLNHDAKKNSWNIFRSVTVVYSSSIIDFDSSAFVGSNVSEAGGQITVGTAGLYIITCSLSQNNNTATAMDFLLYVDGTGVHGTKLVVEGAGPPNYVGQSFACAVSLNANSVVYIAGSGNIYGATSVNSMSYFSGTRIGAIS
jgi:hypothetical protein